MLHRSLFTLLALATSLQAAGLGDPGQLQSLSIETGRSRDEVFTIAGRDAGQQLLVTGHYTNGQNRDLTRQVKYNVTPKGIADVDSTGWVSAVAEGRATIHVTVGRALLPVSSNATGKSARPTSDATTIVIVTDIVRDLPINFPNEVVPIFTKYGCNSGGCHGKSGGQNGFQLSLLGFEPTEDFEHLVKEARGRRVSPAAPISSLLLRKATGLSPHGGGSRIPEDSPSYRIIRRWIEQGLPYGRQDDPVVQRIEVLPGEQLLEGGGSQQLTVVAHYSDGSARDVTRMTQFESNATDIAEVSDSGLVTAAGPTGSAAIMTRYQATVGVFRAIIPLGEPVENLLPPSNFIDELVYKQWTKFGVPPSDVCDDSAFIRRVTIDIAGRLPTLDETTAFLSNNDAKKRDKLIDRLLNSKDYADYFANKWSAVLRNKRTNPGDDPKPTQAFHEWIRESLDQNKPYDQFVREVITATGEVVKVPPAAWYREVHDASAQMEDTAQLFLGLRIQCARCHHHPFEKWSQQDYYGFQAFFAQVNYKKPPPPAKGKNDKKKKKGKPAPPPPLHVLFKEGVASAKNPKTNEAVKPTGLGSQPLDIPANVDPRGNLADWLADKENPFFARSLVNRYWKHFFGRGLVDPEDDMRMTNPATNPELLDALASHFISSNFDMKDLVRTICTSRVYQLSAEANEHNQDDRQNFSRFYPKRLHAEVLLDAIDQLTMSPTRFQGMPNGTRAVQLPDNAFDSYFLTVFGRPNSSSACECERSSDASLAQLLHLINSNEILSKAGGPRATNLAKDKRPHEERIRELYLVALAREPSTEEVSLLTSYVERRGSDAKSAYEDIVWSLINAEEFLFNH